MNYRYYDQKSDLADAFYIRTKVFIEEQGFKDEFDEIDDIAIHVVVYDEQRPVACGRLFPYKDDIMKVGRICTIKEYRGKGIGSIIMHALEKKAKALKAKKIILSAQIQASPFYEKLGYVKKGEIYLDEHCEHIDMEKTF